MKKIIDYEILQANSHDNLQQEVLARMSFGWQPFGGPSCTFLPNIHAWDYYQAIVKYEDSKD